MFYNSEREPVEGAAAMLLAHYLFYHRTHLAALCLYVCVSQLNRYADTQTLRSSETGRLSDSPYAERFDS